MAAILSAEPKETLALEAALKAARERVFKAKADAEHDNVVLLTSTVLVSAASDAIRHIPGAQCKIGGGETPALLVEAPTVFEPDLLDYLRTVFKQHCSGAPPAYLSVLPHASSDDKVLAWPPKEFHVLLENCPNVTPAELQRLLVELARGIYLFDQAPFLSLERVGCRNVAAVVLHPVFKGSKDGAFKER